LRQLERLYADTGEIRYRLAQIELQLVQGAKPESVLKAIEALSEVPDVNQQTLHDLWHRALNQLGDQGVNLPRIQRYLKRYPDDAAMVERLAAMQQAKESAERAARDPANIARKAALSALDQGQLPLAEEQLHKVLAAHPNDAESLGSLGLVRLRQGRHVEAIELFGEANRLSPQNRWQQLQLTARFWGLLRQSDAAVEAHDWPTAVDLVNKALLLQPDNPEALVALADIRKLQSDWPVAADLYRQVLAKQSDNTSALRGLAHVLAKQGQRGQAQTLLDQAVAADPTLAPKLASARAGVLSDQADEHIQAKRFSAAMRDLEAAVLIAPQDPWMRHSLARLYLRLGLPREALSVMDDGVVRVPDGGQMRYARALIRSAAHDDAGALSDLGHIPMAERTDGMAAMTRRAVIDQIVAQIQLPDWSGQASALLDLAEQRAGDDPELLQSVANAWNRLGQPKAGLAVFDRLVRRNTTVTPDVELQHASWMNRAQDDRALAGYLPVLLGRSGWSDAQQDLLLSLYGDHQARQIEARQQSGDVSGARQLAQAPLPESKDSTQRARLRARLLMAAAEYADAATALQQVVQDTPDDVDARLDLANALARQQLTAQASEQALWLRNHVPESDLPAQLALLRLWQRIGDTAQMQALSTKLLSQALPRALVHENADRSPDPSALLLRRYPTDGDVLLQAARLARSQGQFAQAVALFTHARQVESLVAVLPPAPVLVPPGNGDDPLILQLTSRLMTAVKPEVLAVAGTGLSRPDPIQRDIDELNTRLQSWVETGQKRLSKSSTDGISTLNGWERAMVAWFPRGYDGRYFVHMDQVSLNAGALPVNPADAQDYGQVAAWPASTYPTHGAVQRGQARNVGVGYVADHFNWDIGAVGIGFPVTNLVGGFESSGAWGDRRYQWGVARRPLTGSLLSYAGARDPITGQVWGGVVATGASARVSGDVGPYSMSFSASQNWLTGRNVQNNDRTQLRWAADRDVLHTPHSVVNAGLALTATRHAHDLSEYSWGQGGYYSPQRLVSASVPVEWTGRQGALTWQTRAALSWSATSSGSTNHFPTSAALQAQAGQPVYAGASSTGWGRSLRSVVEYQVSQNLALGAELNLDRSADYSPTSFLLYARYLLDPVRVPLENRPQPVRFYSAF
jgi:tetratricopeptide (TPR) repeat protein